MVPIHIRTETRIEVLKPKSKPEWGLQLEVAAGFMIGNENANSSAVFSLLGEHGTLRFVYIALKPSAIVVVDDGISGPAHTSGRAVRFRGSTEDAQIVEILRELKSADAAPLVPNVVYVQVENDRVKNKALGNSVLYRFLIAVGGSETSVSFTTAQSYMRLIATPSMRRSLLLYLGSRQSDSSIFLESRTWVWLDATQLNK
ncbi:hypothetical protein EVAR_82601_1 [Eumeta japonica]|uniref:Uncharacterized protein n=1 Tax=Eumeta variegata TaxID=151549 RepID=A0A4C1X6I4_EUMVA|nr:hypothetical protein EVAR_82601_1 [Eumeta japonica]